MFGYERGSYCKKRTGQVVSMMEGYMALRFIRQGVSREYDAGYGCRRFCYLPFIFLVLLEN